MPHNARARLDELVVTRGLASTRSAARSLIMAGLVLVQGEITDKAGTQVPLGAEIAVRARPRFVSRGGDKLAHALVFFGIDVSGALALDVGASTGGFVDCLLQSGASRVIALDVGRGQLDGRLRQDARVFPLDRANARYLKPEQLPFVPDFLTMDVSFISVAKVLPSAVACMAADCCGLILIKPQFEAGRGLVGKGGIVRDPDVHRRVLLDMGDFIVRQLDANLLGICSSGLLGTDGNAEFFFHIRRGGEKGVELDTLKVLVDEVLAKTSKDKTDV